MKYKTYYKDDLIELKVNDEITFDRMSEVADAVFIESLVGYKTLLKHVKDPVEVWKLIKQNLQHNLDVMDVVAK